MRGEGVRAVLEDDEGRGKDEGRQQTHYASFT